VEAGWASETDPTVETGTPSIDRITIPLHELSALPKASQRLLDDSAFDIEGWLAGRIADKFARSEAAAFLSGDGIDKPTGILTHPAVDNNSWSWGSLGYVATGTDGGIGSGDAIVDLVYALGARYRANATFVMNSKTAGVIRKLKDADGRFLWSDGLAAGEPARLMGYPGWWPRTCPMWPRTATRWPLAILRPATQLPNGPTSGCCAIPSALNRMCCFTPPNASAVMSAILLPSN
jgi:HK97 family phage major capsid protein